jgi:hypothetical protein
MNDKSWWLLPTRTYFRSQDHLAQLTLLKIYLMRRVPLPSLKQPTTVLTTEISSSHQTHRTRSRYPIRNNLSVRMGSVREMDDGCEWKKSWQNGATHTRHWFNRVDTLKGNVLAGRRRPTPVATDAAGGPRPIYKLRMKIIATVMHTHIFQRGH